MEKKNFYEIFLGLLALLVGILLYIEYTKDLSSEQRTFIMLLDYIILVIFATDYVYNLVKADSKRSYVKSHVIELIAIIPFDIAFRAFRLVRLLRLLRLLRSVVYLRKFIRAFEGILNTNGLKVVLKIVLIVVILAASGIYFAEPDITSLGDALWWSIVTTTTVGYGDIAPETIFGRIIAVILMIFGIGFLGLLTGTIATYFIKEQDDIDEEKETIKNMVDNLDKLTTKDKEYLVYKIENYKKHT